MGKRFLDLSVAIPVLLLATPIFLLVALAIKLESAGPVFYRGKRVGLNETRFTMLKFRTMVADAEKRGGPSTPNDDPRITRVGALLRATKLDEIAQFINVLRGEMSLVGPRPQVESDVARYSAEEKALLSTPPGITDYASIRFRNEGEILNGSPDPDRAYNELIRPEKIRLGLYYVRNRSIPTDLEILAKTALALLGCRVKLP
ncbi:MAG: sugar transferase [Elusimicrobia bacterium CG_4_9_14_3_um_filter_62_55]|nr:MAG: sugar transferase [Elusimicrobia bacterium CG22_combo_CG10-13_8_21_14_all_63_91]PJB24386.1 MAG: sugar transferase [Elusimicrobia bacterium CG_4_9_14_3_um_filter_62_55]